jgi:beta-phosphoglucomutase-like phosphatase (HAD superfamily)
MGGGRFELIVFDFDGVIADSETLANQVLADRLTALGFATSLEDALDHYMGRHWADCLSLFEARCGCAAPTGLRAEIDAECERRLGDLREVPGAGAFIRRTAGRPQCIASSSRPDWIERRLAHLGLAERFGQRIFSAAVHVTRGKPHPDIYLHAARAMGAEPGRRLVIEDSPTGVAAGVAAGAVVVGLCAGSHVRPGHAERLAAAGAHHVCGSFEAVVGVLSG